MGRRTERGIEAEGAVIRMGRYRYTATDAMARTVRGSMEAVSEQLAASELRRGGYFPIRIELQPSAQAAFAMDDWLARRRGPSRQEVLRFTQQLHSLLGAGLELDRSLSILAELTENPRMKAITRSVLADIQGGSSLADSLAKHPSVFPRLYVHMVKAGEAGGVVELVLGRLAGFLESAQAIRDEVTSALMYPALVLAAGIGAVIVLLNVVLPRFSGMFVESAELLPAPTQILLAVSALTTEYWWVAAAGLTAALIGLYACLQTDRGRYAWDQAMLRMPVAGQLFLELEVSRFARMLGTLLQSGVPILVALGIVGDTVTNTVIGRSLAPVREGVKRGEGVAGPLKSAGIFPMLAVQMTLVGEESGRLEEMLLKVADVYDLHVKTSVKRLLSLVEPALILVLGVVVGFIVVSMLLAVFSLSELAQ